MTPEDFSRQFATAFSVQNVPALASFIAPMGSVLTLTGAWCENRAQAQTAFEAEAKGIFMRAKLITGKGQVHSLSVDISLLRQRFVIMGPVDETGADLPRFGAMLVAVLQRTGAQWLAQSLTFTALPQ